MTPDEAHRAILEAEELRANIPAYCWRALEFVAGTREEYAIEHQHTPGGQWHQVTGWRHEPPLNDGHTLAPDERIIRRYVTEPEEA